VDSQDNVLVLGSTHTNTVGIVAVLLKYDPTGVLLWESIAAGLDYGGSMALDGLDNIYITGRTFGENWDFRVAKYDSKGNWLWSRQRSWGPGPDEPRSIAVDAAGNVAVVGKNYSSQIAIVVYDTDGNELWSDFLDDPDHAQSYAPNAATFDTEGNLIIAGLKGQVGLVHMLLLKYAPDGTKLFERLYEVGSAHRLLTDAAGNVIVTGQSWTTYDMLTMKVDPQGDPIWISVHERPGAGLGRDLRILSDGGIVVAGSDASNMRWSLVKYDADGVEEWSLTTDPGGFNNYPHMMAVDANDNIALTGSAPITTVLFTATPTATQVPAGDPVPAQAAAYLRAAYPNPFNPAITISYEIRQPGNVGIRVFDTKGMLIRTIVDGYRSAGGFDVVWNGRDDLGKATGSGVYFVRMTADNYAISSKVTLIR